MTTTIQGVQARLGRNPEDPRKYQVTVLVYSQVRPGLKSSTDIDPGQCASQQHLLQMIGTAGAACAEYLGEKYGDNIDPVAASRDALRAFGEECRLMAELAKDVPAKLKRLESNVAKLSNENQEQLRRLRYLVDHQERLLPKEVAWLNQRLGELHGGQL